jgi:hypothetical protein
MIDAERIDGRCTAFDARKQAQTGLDSDTQILIAEFADGLPAGTVIRSVARAREELLHSGVRRGLALATVAMARHRLQASLRPADRAGAPTRRVVQPSTAATTQGHRQRNDKGARTIRMAPLR